MPRGGRSGPNGIRAGFTLAELLVVVVITGVLATVSLPRFARMRNVAQLNAATSQFTRSIMSAREAAIRRGRRSYFRSKDNLVWVIVDTVGNDSVIVATPYSLTTGYGVQLVSPVNLSTIEYDPRGVARSSTKMIFAFKHLPSGKVDSLCVSKLGNLIQDRCP
jgi:prepilin-type N-terminal cleavage/methylation domain-containing protein